MPLYQSSSVPDTVRETYLTAGAVTFGSDAAWTLYPAAGISIPAAVGDWVELWVTGMWANAAGGNDFIDWAVVVSSAAVRYSSSDTATPATQGDPAYYPNSGFFKGTGPFAFKVTSGDLDAGAVNFQVAHIGAPGGGTLYTSTSYPMRLYAVNKHTVS